MRLPGSSKSKDGGVGSALTKILSPRSKQPKLNDGETPSDSPLLGGGVEMSDSVRPPRREVATFVNEGAPPPAADDDAASSSSRVNKTMHDAVGGGGGRRVAGYDRASHDRERATATLSPSTAAAAGDDGGEAGGGGGGEEIEAIFRGGKLGHKFLFVCCDSKRAVVVLTSTMLLLNGLVIASAVIEHGGQGAEGFVNAMVMHACGMFVTFCVLLGAFWYSIHVVVVGLVYAAYQLTVGIIRITRYDWDGGGDGDTGKLVVLLPFVMNALIFYAEAVFISEVNEGIISADTYKERERYSCCCNWL